MVKISRVQDEEHVLRQIDEEQLQLDRAYAIHMASMVESNRFIHCNLDVSNHILHLEKIKFYFLERYFSLAT
jgi:hypothetical protein